MNIVMMGIQGSGKGTQGKLLAAHLGLPHVSTGDILRANLREGTPLGRKAQEFMGRGELVPDALVNDMVRERLAAPDAARGVILDGFPRSAVQLAALEYLRPVDHAVLLELDDRTAIARLGHRSECTKCAIIYGANRPPKKDGACDQCGGPLKVRTDDTDAEAVRKRLQLYHQEIAVLVDYYQWKGVLRRVDGSHDVPTVFQAILRALRLP